LSIGVGREEEMEMIQREKVSELISRLAQGSTYEMLNAAEEIGRVGEEAVLAVAPLLRSPHREMRWRAAIALERIGPPAVEALMVAAEEREWTTRVPAIWALEHIGDRQAVPTLVENLNGENECCRWMAAAALTRIGTDREVAIVEAAFVNDPAGRGFVEELIEGS
jgi:HEAT repeat protein